MYEQLLQEGRQGILLTVLEAKFGSLPESVRARVVAGDRADVVRWAINVLSADSFDAVFAPQAPPPATSPSDRSARPSTKRKLARS